MKLIELLCPRCGAMLKVDTSSKQAYCEHCSTIFLIDDEVKRIRVDDAEEVGYKFEKGRQRAQSEKGRSTYSEYSQKDSAARSDYRSDAYSDYKHQADPEPSSYEPPAPPKPEEKKKPAWHIVFWILGWIFIFPIPLIFLISRGKKTREGEGGRIFIVLIAIIIYMIIAYNVLDEIIPQNFGYFSYSRSYIGDSGYITVSDKDEWRFINSKEFPNKDLWVVPTFEREWIIIAPNETGTLPHKTEVVVRGTVGVRRDNRHGYLLVERKDDGSRYYIAFRNFTETPYWNDAEYMENVKDHVALGHDVTAEYRQISGYKPITQAGKEIEIPDGTIVLVTGYSNRLYNDVEARVWYDWPKGYGVKVCFFNSHDLTVVW